MIKICCKKFSKNLKHFWGGEGTLEMGAEHKCQIRVSAGGVRDLSGDWPC